MKPDNTHKSSASAVPLLVSIFKKHQISSDLFSNYVGCGVNDLKETQNFQLELNITGYYSITEVGIQYSLIGYIAIPFAVINGYVQREHKRLSASILSG